MEKNISIFSNTMAEMNWKDVERAGKRKALVLFPIGVIEEHGPHLPLGSDIIWSSRICQLVCENLNKEGKETLVAPPYYWGINHCTSAFPGTFSLKPQTMTQVLYELFENLADFSFQEIYCFNYHGDEVHIHAIVESIKRANEALGMKIKLVVEQMDLELYGWNGQEDFLLVVSPDYPMEWFMEQDESERGLFDIHAGAYETAVLEHLCPERVNLENVSELPSYSLNQEQLGSWMQGGESARKVIPLGYAGNPAGYQAVKCHVEDMLKLQVEEISRKIRNVGFERK